MVALELELKQFSIDFFSHFRASILSAYHSCRSVRDDQSDQNFESNDQMLNQDCKENNVGSVPERRVSLVQILNEHTFFFIWKTVQVLSGSDLLGWEATDNQDNGVDRDSKVRDESHDLHPVANSTRALGIVSSAIGANMLQFDLYFKQVGEEREQRSEGERSSKERNETNLHVGFIVEGSQAFSRWSHHQLLLNLLVHLEVSKRHLILS